MASECFDYVTADTSTRMWINNPSGAEAEVSARRHFNAL